MVVGSCIGAVFHLVNKAAGSLGLVFYPALSATAPALVTLAVALVLLRRVP